MGSLCPSRKTYCKQREVSLTSSILTVPVDFRKPGKGQAFISTRGGQAKGGISGNWPLKIALGPVCETLSADSVNRDVLTAGLVVLNCGTQVALECPSQHWRNKTNHTLRH